MQRVEISEDQKCLRVENVKNFKMKRDAEKTREAIRKLKTVAGNGGNVFEITMEIVKEVTLDEWTRALQEVYGIFRRKI